MIKPLLYRRLSLDEKLAFASEVVSVFDSELGRIPVLMPLVSQMKDDYLAVRLASIWLSHPELTQAVRSSDAQRDLGLRTLKYVASQSLKRSDAAWVTAGKLILQALHDFGNDIARHSTARESAEVDNLLAEFDCNADLREAVSTIQCDAWLQDIRDGQHQVKRAIANRDAVQVNEPQSPAYKLAFHLVKSLSKLFRFINVKLEFEQTPELVALSNRINVIVVRYRATIKHRETLRKQAKERKAAGNEAEQNDKK